MAGRLSAAAAAAGDHRGVSAGNEHVELCVCAYECVYACAHTYSVSRLQAQGPRYIPTCQQTHMDVGMYRAGREQAGGGQGWRAAADKL